MRSSIEGLDINILSAGMASDFSINRLLTSQVKMILYISLAMPGRWNEKQGFVRLPPEDEILLGFANEQDA
jgi:hypothetical protein